MSRFDSDPRLQFLPNPIVSVRFSSFPLRTTPASFLLSSRRGFFFFAIFAKNPVFSRERETRLAEFLAFYSSVPIISKKSIEEIRSRADIVAFIGDYTNLRRSGSKWKGLSPFTDEKTPSFFVDPDKGFYYCFSTGQGGDIFKFLMARENLSFAESVERVASRFGITIEYEKGGSHADRTLRGELFDIHEFAAGYFSEKFREDTSISAAVRNYWVQNRGFEIETAKSFRIGFLPSGGSRAFAEALVRKGFSVKALAESGIFVGTERSGEPARWLSRFESRLIVPIADIQRRIIAFTARKIPGITPDDGRGMNEAKYINSSETAIFHKGSTLFNIDKAKDFYANHRADADGGAATRETPFVLVEGQLDAIRCWECGIRSAVAGQGTGITETQLQLLRRYSDRLDCFLDADAAGQKAALRLAPIAFKTGLDLRFLSVPGGKDPDEFLLKNGAGAIPVIRESAVSAITFVAQKFFPFGAKLTPAQRQSALEAVFEIISASPSEVFCSDCLVKLAQIAGLDRLAVERDFSRFRASRQADERARVGYAASPAPVKAPDAGNSPLTTAEEDVLILALNHDEIAPLFANVIPPDWLDSGACAGRLLNRIFAEISEGEWRGANSIHGLLETDEDRDFVARIRNGFDRGDTEISREELESRANECLKGLCAKACERERRALDLRIGKLSSDSPELLECQRRRIELRRISKNPPRIVLKQQF